MKQINPSKKQGTRLLIMMCLIGFALVGCDAIIVTVVNDCLASSIPPALNVKVQVSAYTGSQGFSSDDDEDTREVVDSDTAVLEFGQSKDFVFLADIGENKLTGVYFEGMIQTLTGDVILGGGNFFFNPDSGQLTLTVSMLDHNNYCGAGVPSNPA